MKLILLNLGLLLSLTVNATTYNCSAVKDANSNSPVKLGAFKADTSKNIAGSIGNLDLRTSEGLLFSCWTIQRNIKKELVCEVCTNDHTSVCPMSIINEGDSSLGLHLLDYSTSSLITLDCSK